MTSCAHNGEREGNLQGRLHYFLGLEYPLTHRTFNLIMIMMKYEGNLYGKVGKHYFPLEHTSYEFDKNKELLKEARDLLVMCTLLDKSGQCINLVNKIDGSDE